jgi:RHS repeat-associated protein
MPGLKGKYDAWNRLIEVRDLNDNLIASYEYNGLNQRIKKTVGTTVTKSFFNENWQEVESGTNNQVTNYVWGLRYIDDLVLREKGEERLYSLADPNWNVVAICDVDGDIQERYTYDAFGKWTVFDTNFTTKAGTEFNWNRSFTGQVLDSETGMMLYRMRYYDVVFGRFVNRDPIEYWGDATNLYQYVFNNSLLSFDPLGLSPGTLVVCAGGAAACDGPLLIGDIVACILLVQAAREVAAMKRAQDHSKNEKHGDGGRALDSVNKEINRLNDLIKKLAEKPGNSNEIKKILKKIQRIKEGAQKKKKGEEHNRVPKR